MVFDFEQPSLYLGKVSKDGTASKSAFLLVKDMAGTTVKDVSTSSEFINARMLDFTDNNGQYDRLKMEVTTLPGLPLGRINETITVKTNLADKPSAVLRITGSVIGDVEVTPEWMTFVVTDASAARPMNLTKKIFITSHIDGAALEIVDVKDSEGHLDLKIKTLATGKKYELTATLKPESIPDRGNISGNVVLTTNFPSQKEVAIRYSAVRKSYQGKDGKRTSVGKPAGTGSPSLRDGQSTLKQGTGEGLFAPSKDDPFAVGGELSEKGARKEKEATKKESTEARKKLSSSKENVAKKLPSDTDAKGEAEKVEEK